MGLVLLVVLVLVLFGGLPDVGYPHNYGYYPSGITGILVLIVIICLLTGRL